jgi:hypothetical protein
MATIKKAQRGTTISGLPTADSTFTKALGDTTKWKNIPKQSNPIPSRLKPKSAPVYKGKALKCGGKVSKKKK